MNVKKYYLRIGYYIILSLVSFLFLSIFSYFTSPLSAHDNGFDSAFFMLVGQGMTKGYLPYRDFFDMKGPILFLIEYFGQMIVYGRTGIFIVQCLNLTLVFITICSIFESYHINNRFLQLILLLPIAFVLSFTLEGGNLTEEFSLFPLLSCLLLCTTFFNNCEKTDKKWQHDIYWYSGAWFGVCFGALLLIRITNAALLCAMVISILIYLLQNHKVKELLICIQMFVFGLIAVVGPTFLFFAVKGLLIDMLEAVFCLGFFYSREKSLLQHLVEILFVERRQQLLLLIIPCCMPILVQWRGWKEQVLAFLGGVFTFFGIALGNNYTHYYTLAVPLLVLIEVSVIETLHTKNIRKALVAVLLFSIMLFPQYSIMNKYVERAYSHLFNKQKYNTESLVQDISSNIPEQDKHSVFCYNLDPAWYTYAGLFPCIKYCGWQNHYIDLMPGIYDELEDIFTERPPSWLVLPNPIGDVPDFLENKLSTDYQEVYQNTSYILYNYITQPSA